MSVRVGRLRARERPFENRKEDNVNINGALEKEGKRKEIEMVYQTIIRLRLHIREIGEKIVFERRMVLPLTWYVPNRQATP